MGINCFIWDIITLVPRFAQGISILYRYAPGEKGHYKRQRTQVLKKLEKGVDKWREAWYSNQAVREMRDAADRNFEEIQKAVDKRKTVCYNLKVVADKRQPSE